MIERDFNESVAYSTISSWSDLRVTVLEAIKNGNTIALWRKPETDNIFLYVCSSNAVNEYTEIALEKKAAHPQFIFAPFLPFAKKIVLESPIIFQIKERFQNNHTHSNRIKQPVAAEKKIPFYFLSKPPTTRVSYRELVKKAVLKIENGVFEKVVVSRHKDIPVTENFDLLNTFEWLCVKNLSAMVCLFSSPQTGTWLNASPELLLSTDLKHKFKTHALAGTLPYSTEAIIWSSKEVQEQALVCQYIINCFEKINIPGYVEHGPETIAAGNVMHLRTNYEIDLSTIKHPNLSSEMLKLLHPTPAICGAPLEPSIHFLLEHEGYDREFYGGYLGPINHHHQTDLYVNLRCLQYLGDHVRLYAGAGITLHSSPQKEWEETEVKMRNMMDVLTIV